MKRTSIISISMDRLIKCGLLAIFLLSFSAVSAQTPTSSKKITKTSQSITKKKVAHHKRSNKSKKQEIAPIVEEEKVQQLPQFPGGIQSLYEFLNKEIQYPASAKEAGIQGKVIVRFVVEKDGSIKDIRIVKSLDPYLDEEAIRVVKMIPLKWIPGKQHGYPVPVSMIIPIVFHMKDE